MRLTRATILAAPLLAIATCVCALAQTTHKQQLWVQDPETKVFHPVAPGEDLVPDASTTSPTAGTITVSATITLKTAVPSGYKVVCNANLAATSLNLTTYAQASYSESASTYATVSGSTASCNVAVPYSWLLPTASSTVQNSLSGDLMVEIVSVTGAGSTTAVALPRYTEVPIATGGKVPTSATTTYALAVTL